MWWCVLSMCLCVSVPFENRSGGNNGKPEAGVALSS